MCMLISHSTPSSFPYLCYVIDSRMANTAVNTHDVYAIRKIFIFFIIDILIIILNAVKKIIFFKHNNSNRSKQKRIFF